MSKNSTESNQKLLMVSMSIFAVTALGCLFTMIYLFSDEPEIQEAKVEKKQPTGAAADITKIAASLKANIEKGQELSQFGQQSASSLEEFVMAQGRSPDQTDRLRYIRTQTALLKCGNDYADLLDHYTRKNQPRYEKLLKKQAGADEKNMASLSQTSQQLQNIETPADLLKFQLSGGSVQHVGNSLNMMQSFLELDGEYPGGYSSESCRSVREQAQRGKLDLRR